MQKQLEQVREFHEAFGVPQLNEPQLPAAERARLRVKLIREELEELEQALDNGNLVEVADAITDIQYVVLGSVLEFGMQERFEAMFDEVHSSNMSKLDEDGKPIHRDDGKVLKSDRYFRPNLAQFVANSRVGAE